MVFIVSICGLIYIKIHIGFEMLCYDAILAKTGIFKGMSQLFDIKSVHWSIIPLTAQVLLSPSSCPAVNADLRWRNTVSENKNVWYK